MQSDNITEVNCAELLMYLFPILPANLYNYKYAERLKRLNLPTLKYRLIRGDMIEVYKIFSGKYDDDIVTSWLTVRHFVSSYDLRGHRFS